MPIVHLFQATTRGTMSVFEVAILVMIFVGFLGLIAYVARHARSDE